MHIAKTNKKYICKSNEFSKTSWQWNICWFTHRNHFIAVRQHSRTFWKIVPLHRYEDFFFYIFISKHSYSLAILCYCRELIISVNTLNTFFFSLSRLEGVEKMLPIQYMVFVLFLDCFFFYDRWNKCWHVKSRRKE